MTGAPSLKDIHVLLPYQQRWIADKSKVKICEKSRRIGLTWAEAADDVLEAASEGGQDVWYIGYNKEMAEEFIRDCADWARFYQVAAEEIAEEVIQDEDRDILTYVIRFASGFRITALSSRPSNLRGKQGRVVIDEAAFHDQLGELLKAALALLIWGGEVRIISTHDGDINPFNELILDCRAGRKPYSVHRIEFREAVREGLYQRICLSTGQAWSQAAEDAWVAKMYADYGDDAAEELDVIPASGEGSFLSRAIIEACMVDGLPVLHLTMPPEFATQPPHIREDEVREWCERHVSDELWRLNPLFPHYFGSDFARSGDVSVIAPIEETDTLRLEVPFVIEMRNVPFEQQRQVLFYLIDRLPRFRSGAMDARGNGQYLAEVAMQRYGSTRVAQVMLSTEWYREHMPRLKAHFEDRTLEIPKHADLLTDLRLVRKERGVAKVPDDARARGVDGGQRHGDFAIALALGAFAVATMDSGPIEHQSIGPRAGISGVRAFVDGVVRRIGGSLTGGNDFRGYN